MEKSPGKPVPVNCGSSQPPSARWVRDQPRDAALDAAAAVARRRRAARAAPRPSATRSTRRARPTAGRVERRSSPQPPSAFWCSVQPRAPRAGSRDWSGVDARRDQRGHHGAGAVDVVGAPPAEPGAVRLLRRRAATRRRAGTARLSASPSAASISTTCAVTSADGGSITAPKSQNGSLLASSRVLSASNAPQPPSRDCMPTTQAHAALDGAPRRRRRRGDAAQREHDLGGVVDVGVAVVGELERPAARRRASGRRTAQSPRHADLLAQQPVGRAGTARVVGRHAGVEQRGHAARCPTPATGTPPAGAPTPSGVSSRTVKPSSPSSRPPHAGGRAGSRAGAARAASRPTAAGCRPSDPSASWRARIHSAAAAQRGRRSGRDRRAGRSACSTGRAAGTRRAQRQHGVRGRRGGAGAQLVDAERQRPHRPQGRRRWSAARSSAGPSTPSRRC